MKVQKKRVLSKRKDFSLEEKTFLLMKRIYSKWKGFTLIKKDLYNEKLGRILDEKDLLFYEKVFQMKRFSTFLFTCKRN